MLKNYPATQLFLMALLTLSILIFLAPLAKEWNAGLGAVLDSLSFILKVICGFLLYFTFIDIIDGVHFHRQRHGSAK